jgi:hypothetical protein
MDPGSYSAGAQQKTRASFFFILMVLPYFSFYCFLSCCQEVFPPPSVIELPLGCWRIPVQMSLMVTSPVPI